ncbi:MAG TPA: DUF2845 domain-containing protein [Myxococcales bacterium]
MTKRVYAYGIAAAMLAFASAARAGEQSGARCDGGLIELGDGPTTVQARCGEPTARDRRVEAGPTARPNDVVTVDEWTYDRGPQSFILVLRFENGKLARVEEQDYGHATQ